MCRPAITVQSHTPPSVPTSTLTDGLPTFPVLSKAGASAQLMYDRKHQRRADQIEQEWGRLSGVVKFLSDDP